MYAGDLKVVVEKLRQYQAAAQPFLVFGILTTALAVGHAY